MDEERLSLLQEDLADEKDKDCLIMGMELLRAASQSSSLAAHYLTMLQPLNGEDVHLRRANASHRSDVAENDYSQGLADFQNGMLPVGIVPLDPLWGVNLDFGDSDDWLSATELWGDSLTSADKFVSW